MRQLMLLGTLLSFFAMTSVSFAADVYATKNGKKFHKEDCRLIKNKGAVKIDEAQAKAKGLEACKVCFKATDEKK